MCDPKTWEMIKAEYLQGSASFAKLSKKYGVSKASIQRRSAAEGWMNLRESIRTATESKVTSAIADQQADHLLKYYEMLEAVQDQLMTNAGMPASNKGLSDLTLAMRTAFDMTRELYGIPTEQQLQGRERLSIEREKVKLQQKQLEQDQPDDTVRRWVIEMPPEVEDGEQ